MVNFARLDNILLTHFKWCDTLTDAVNGGQEEVVTDEGDENEAVECDTDVHKEGTM